MTTYAALLRGINVGGHRKMPMAELRELIRSLGWTDVRTYLQSGNAVFSVPPGSEAKEPSQERLEHEISRHFGYEVSCLLRTSDELRAVAADCPYPAAQLDPAKLLVFFLEEAPAPDHFAPLAPEAYAPDTFEVGDRAVYCYFPDGMGRSKLPDALGSLRPELTMTGRNWRTVTKLLELTA